MSKAEEYYFTEKKINQANITPVWFCDVVKQLDSVESKK
jgi:hypothetical protein